MSLEKAILHGKERRKPHGMYCPPNKFPCNGAHNGCNWCLNNRLNKYRRELQAQLEAILEFEQASRKAHCVVR